MHSLENLFSNVICWIQFIALNYLQKYFILMNFAPTLIINAKPIRKLIVKTCSENLNKPVHLLLSLITYKTISFLPKLHNCKIYLVLTLSKIEKTCVITCSYSGIRLLTNHKIVMKAPHVLLTSLDHII